MNKSLQRDIEVYAHWVGLTTPSLIGALHTTPARGKEIFSFEYCNEWPKHPQTHALDPSLQLFQGTHYAPTKHQNFGFF